MSQPAGVVLPLTVVGAVDLPRVGGKAANLGELIRAGFRVPEGFVVLTVAYRATLAGAGLSPPGETGSSPQDVAGSDSFEAAVGRVKLPQEVAEAIIAAYQVLGAGPVAVRSSATAEDLPGAAFAGQQESFLNVIGPEAVLDAVRGCWASLWAERAVTYRRRFSSDPDPAMAVVVQRMVPAEFAGVMFTANPVTGVRDEVVIEAGSGLGEAVVSGLVTPEHVVVDRHCRIRERRAGWQEVVVRGAASGGIIHENADAQADAALPPGVLQNLAAVGVRIASHFGRPQDIEWAFADGTAWVVQARALTALPPAPVTANLARRTAAAVCAELLPTRPFPLDMTAWTVPGWFGILQRMAFELPAVRIDLVGMFPESGGVVTELVPPRLNLTLRTLSTPLRVRAGLRRHDPAHWTDDPRFAAFAGRAVELEDLHFASLDWSAVLEVPGDVLAALNRFVDLRIDYLPGFAVGLVRLRAMLAVLGASREFWPLTSGQTTLTQAANDQLESIAQEVRANPSWARAFSELDIEELVDAVWRGMEFGHLRIELNSWLGAYGHRETSSPALISSPTWADDPRLLLESLRSLAVRPAAPANDAGRGAAEKRLRDHWLVRLTRSESRILHAAAAARAGLAFREDSHFHVLRLRPVMRRAALEAGRRLAAAGALAAAEDVFHLKLEEVGRFGDPHEMDADQLQQIGELVRQRTLRRAELGTAPLISPATLHPGVLRPASDALAAGTPGGGGRATGPVRIIRDPNEFSRLKAGDVLVCPYTNPAWTPLFALAAAVVADTGSFASHAAIVAREYGIPAIMGTGNGTAVLHDGLVVTVDGSRGDVVAAKDSRSHD